MEWAWDNPTLDFVQVLNENLIAFNSVRCNEGHLT